jgi:rod shape-determining protein MreC
VSLAPERFASRRDSLAFLLCLLLSVAARVAPVGVQDAVVSGITNTVLAPFLAVQAQATLLRESRGAYTRLVAQRDSAVMDANDLFPLQQENERLRQLVGLSARLNVPHASAEVLRQVSAMESFTLVLSAGRNRGILPMAPVITPAGLVGVVRTVDTFTSVAIVWTHPDFRASAMTEDGKIFGIIAPRGSEGLNTFLMELNGVPYVDEIPLGTAIYTSGQGTQIGGVYPRGIPIGDVIGVGEEEEGWSRTYVVRPAVHPGSVTHVVILTASTTDVDTAFEEPE